MTLHVEENHLVSLLRVRFPSDAGLTDRWLLERGWDPVESDGMAYVWVEAFADRTTDAIKHRDASAVRSHTGFMAEQYRANSEALCAIIDVSYAENLMWNASDDDKAWAWEFIAFEIQQLYEQCWGKPSILQTGPHKGGNLRQPLAV